MDCLDLFLFVWNGPNAQNLSLSYYPNSGVFHERGLDIFVLNPNQTFAFTLGNNDQHI